MLEVWSKGQSRRCLDELGLIGSMIEECEERCLHYNPSEVGALATCNGCPLSSRLSVS